LGEKKIPGLLSDPASNFAFHIKADPCQVSPPIIKQTLLSALSSLYKFLNMLFNTIAFTFDRFPRCFRACSCSLLSPKACSIFRECLVDMECMEDMVDMVAMEGYGGYGDDEVWWIRYDG
jgi:hypothetical protein